jgi:hypothetical protein
MTWINLPETVRRFNIHQMIQHWSATAAGTALVVTAAISPFVSSGRPARYHVVAGMAGTAIFFYHLLALGAIGIRDDVPAEKVAFLPHAGSKASKYNAEERGDYLNVLLWSALLVVSGILLRWPGRFGIPGPRAYFWLRAFHAGCGAAWVIHLLSGHVTRRWFQAPEMFRRAIFTGTVPLSEASTRADWIAELVSAGLLVPAPAETVTEDHRESGQVRDLLEKGNRLTREGRYEEALAAFEEALTLYPQYSQARYNLGIVRMKMGDMERAGEQFRMFIEADPFNPVAGKAREMLDEIAGKKDGNTP